MTLATIKKVAIAFSNGQFDTAIPHLDAGVVWEVVGENTFTGKREVIAQCQKVAAYFNSVETLFSTDQVHQSDGTIVVRGTAEFTCEGQQINFISACDVYEFNIDHTIQKIISYCITEKK